MCSKNYVATCAQWCAFEFLLAPQLLPIWLKHSVLNRLVVFLCCPDLQIGNNVGCIPGNRFVEVPIFFLIKLYNGLSFLCPPPIRICIRCESIAIIGSLISPPIWSPPEYKVLKMALCVILTTPFKICWITSSQHTTGRIFSFLGRSTKYSFLLPPKTFRK